MNTPIQKKHIKKIDTQKQYYLMSSHSDENARKRFRMIPYCGMCQLPQPTLCLDVGNSSQELVKKKKEKRF